MSLLLLWLIMGGVVAVIANSKGFDTFGWLVYGALLWPIALAHVIVRPSAASTAPAVADEVAPQKRCPDCAEAIMRDAKVCRFCGNREFPEAVEPALTEDEAFFASLAVPAPRPPQPTMWQKLWWNPHTPDRRR